MFDEHCSCTQMKGYNIKHDNKNISPGNEK